jgi:hypothetical protein
MAAVKFEGDLALFFVRQFMHKAERYFGSMFKFFIEFGYGSRLFGGQIRCKKPHILLIKNYYIYLFLVEASMKDF